MICILTGINSYYCFCVALKRVSDELQRLVFWIPTRHKCNTDPKTNMATCMSMVVKGTALAVLKPLVRLCRRQRTGVLIPRRFAHGPRSSLYEHVREGYSDKPELDMRAVCEETDKVIANVENRKGDLQGDDVRKIVSFLFRPLSNIIFFIKILIESVKWFANSKIK